MNNIICSLVITGDDLDPQYVSAEMERVPTQAYRRGEVYVGKTGASYKRISGIWTISSESAVKIGKVADHLQFILEVIRENRQKLIKLKDNNVRVSVRITCELGDDIFSETLDSRDIEEMHGAIDGLDLVIT